MVKAEDFRKTEDGDDWAPAIQRAVDYAGKLPYVSLPLGEPNVKRLINGGRDCAACDTRNLPVRDCMGRCSACGRRVESIDYLHTCQGGHLCEYCKAIARQMGGALPDGGMA